MVVALALRQDGHCGRGNQRPPLGGCGESLTVPDDDGELAPVHVDHIVPIALGGADALGNMQLLHERCHLAKTASE